MVKVKVSSCRNVDATAFVGAGTDETASAEAFVEALDVLLLVLVVFVVDKGAAAAAVGGNRDD